MGKCRARNQPCRSGARCPGAGSMNNSPMNTPAQNSKPVSANSATSPTVIPSNLGRGGQAEDNGLTFLKTVAPTGWSLEATGKNSKFSDIQLRDASGASKCFIEVKQLPSAAGGQIVVEKVGDTYTSVNSNPHTPDVLQIINKHESSENSSKLIVPVTADEEQVVWNWMNTHWESKGVKGFYFTDKDNSYEKLVHIDDVENHVSLVLNKPRNKRSGSGNPSKADRPVIASHFVNLLGSGNFKIRDDGKRMFIKPKGVTLQPYQPIGDRVFYLANTSAYFEEEGELRITKQALTNNPNVIIKLVLKGHKVSTSPTDIRQFFESIR